ncbi:MAG: IS3 family transposase [Candidatus Binatia bacterium]
MLQKTFPDPTTLFKLSNSCHRNCCLPSHHQGYHTRDQARLEIFEYIELFYNRRRIRQLPGYEAPLV